MLRILFILFLARYADQPAYEQKFSEPQQITETVEFGDCIQLPPQKTLGDD